MVTYTFSITDAMQFFATLFCGVFIYFLNPTKSPIRSFLFTLFIGALTVYLFLFGSHNTQIIAGAFLLSSFVSFFPSMRVQKVLTGQPVTIVHILSLVVALVGFVVLFYKAGYFQDYTTLTINGMVALALILCMVIWGFIMIFSASSQGQPAQQTHYSQYRVVEEDASYQRRRKR